MVIRNADSRQSDGMDGHADLTTTPRYRASIDRGGAAERVSKGVSSRVRYRAALLSFIQPSVGVRRDPLLQPRVGEAEGSLTDPHVR